MGAAWFACSKQPSLAGPVQHFRAAVLEAWRKKVSADLCAWKGFRGGTLRHVRERDKALLRGVLAGGGFGFLLGKVWGPACALSVLRRC